MNAYERIITALNHEEADRVPTFTQSIEPDFILRYDEEYEIKGEENLPRTDLQLALELGFDSKWIHLGKSVTKEKRPEIPKDLHPGPNKMIDSAGHVYEIGSTGRKWYIDGIIKTPELMKDWISYIKTYEPAEEKFFKDFKKEWDYCLQHDFVPIPTAGGPTYTTWASIGMNRFGYMMRKYPVLVKDMLHAWTNVAIGEHKCIFEQGIDMVFICDDHAFKDRIMMRPDDFREFIVPNFRRIADNAHKYGAKFLLHTDGNLWEEMECLCESRVDAAEPLEYESGMRLKPLKEKYGDRIALIGNVASSDILTFGSIEDTIKATKQCILDAAEGGGYILAPGANILDTCKIENVLAMTKTAKKYGIYPINKQKLME